MPEINTAAEFDKALADGPYAWPGGYPLYFVMSDGESMSFASATENAALIRTAIEEKSSDGWRVIGVDINYEDPDLICAHSGARIESAYAEDSAKDGE